jgi:GTP cyclohydrolase I
MQMSHQDLVFSIKELLDAIGEDPEREGLQGTPERVIRSWGELYGGYEQSPADLFTTFESDHDEMVLLRDIEFFSMCEHHMLPFFGKAHIAYLPDQRVIGISKLARLLEVYSRRLQIQERIGQQVADDLMTYLKPKGCAVVLEAKHLCMVARGVNKQNSLMTTSVMRGAFRTSPSLKDEFLSMCRG